MKTPLVLVALTVTNIFLLTFSFARPGATEPAGVAQVLRARAFEIVDDRGRVRASISVFPANPDVKMPDGTTGYPETVLFRLINSKGAPNVKISASEDGAALLLGGESDPTYAQILARGGTPSLKLSDKSGQVKVIAP